MSLTPENIPKFNQNFLNTAYESYVRLSTYTDEPPAPFDSPEAFSMFYMLLLTNLLDEEYPEN